LEILIDSKNLHEIATQGKAAEMGVKGVNYPRASRSKGPHNTPCYKVWGAL